MYFMNNLLFKTKEIETLNNCPWCKSKRIFQFKVFKSLKLSKCANCMLVFTSSRVKEKCIEKYYGPSYIEKNSNASLINNEKHHIFYRRELYNIKSLLKSEQNKLLDIGCGGGAFAKIAIDENFDVTVNDIDAQNIKFLQDKYKIKGYAGKIENINFKEAPFDVIVLHHVLEHVYDLHSFIDKLSKIIKPNGVININIPNLFSLDCKFDKKLYYKLLSLPFHTFHFNRRTLINIFNKKNFVLLKEEHSDSKILISPFIFIKKILKRSPKSKLILKKKQSKISNQGYLFNYQKENFIRKILSYFSYGEQMCFYFKKK